MIDTQTALAHELIIRVGKLEIMMEGIQNDIQSIMTKLDKSEVSSKKK